MRAVETAEAAVNSWLSANKVKSVWRPRIFPALFLPDAVLTLRSHAEGARIYRPLKCERCSHQRQSIGAQPVQATGAPSHGGKAPTRSCDRTLPMCACPLRRSWTKRVSPKRHRSSNGPREAHQILARNRRPEHVGSTGSLISRWRIEHDYCDISRKSALGTLLGPRLAGFHHYGTLSIASYGFLISERKRIPLRSHFAARIEKCPVPIGYRLRSATSPTRSPEPAAFRATGQQNL